MYLFLFQNKAKKLIQPCKHVATFEGEVLAIAQKALKNKMPASTFNKLRGLKSDEQLKLMRQFEESDYSRSFFKNEATKMKTKVR